MALGLKENWMIASSRNYPFDSRVTTIHTPSYSCMVSTAKESLSEPQSTAVFQMPKAELEPRTGVAKILYVTRLSAEERLRIHDTICTALDKSGEDNEKLGEAIDKVSASLKARGLVEEIFNLLSGPLGPMYDVLSQTKKS